LQTCRLIQWRLASIDGFANILTRKGQILQTTPSPLPVTALRETVILP
jgi:hypothetical protein